jgi:protocatechuate 3,4-dioxygenase beta subunit
MANCYIKKYFMVIVVLMLILVKTGYATAHNGPGRGKAMPDTVSGVVLDEYGNPLKGVKVTVKGNPMP